ncbi:glycosyltransferase, partial [Vibrio vulnificus]|nr:glycosyltransferase [Vibrio vulnificus]
MKALFVHDHVFIDYNGKYYSNGKLTYGQLSYYLSFCSELTVVGRKTLSNDEQKLQNLSEGNGIHVIGLDGPLSLRGIIYRRNLINQLRSQILLSDCVFVRMPSELGLLALKIARKYCKKVVVEMVACPFDCLWYRGDLGAKMYAPFLKYRVKQSLKNENFVIYVTHEFLQNKYPTSGIAHSFSDVIITSIQPPRYMPIKQGSRLRIGVIANPSLKLKGISVLFDAIKKLDKNKFQLSIVGGALNSDLEEKMGLHENIEQVGIVTDKKHLNNWFESLDIYVQPSFTEGLPRSVIEAMSFGIPVIGSNTGGIPELVHNDLLFPVGDSDALSVLIKYFSSADIYSKYSYHSVQRAMCYSN